MGQLIFDQKQIEHTMDNIVRRTMDMDMTWGWPLGVACYGISKAYEVTKKDWYLQIMKDRIDELIHLGLTAQTVNTCAMGHCLITLYETVKEESYLDLIHSMTEYLTLQAPRFGPQVLQHTVSAANDFPEQCWAAYTLSHAGAYLRESYLYPEYMDMMGSLDELLTALKKLQTKDGLWRTILDDEDSYEEVSASAGIAAAMAARHNPLHISYIQKALGGILNHVAADGKVRNVSGGTAVMKNKEGYCRIPRTWIQGWGQGLALAFLAEVLLY